MGAAPRATRQAWGAITRATLLRPSSYAPLVAILHGGKGATPAGATRQAQPRRADSQAVAVSSERFKPKSTMTAPASFFSSFSSAAACSLPNCPCSPVAACAYCNTSATCAPTYSKPHLLFELRPRLENAQRLLAADRLPDRLEKHLPSRVPIGSVTSRIRSATPPFAVNVASRGVHCGRPGRYRLRPRRAPQAEGSRRRAPADLREPLVGPQERV